MLDQESLQYRYRDYVKEPLDAKELKALFVKLGVSPRDVLRTADAKKAGLAPDLSDAALLKAMAENPRLLQRPIYVRGDRAVVGRPVERLFEIL